MNRLLLTLLLLITGFSLSAQTKKWDEGVINPLKQDGRIYIVIVVIAIIVLGLFWYMWRMDKKISRIENQARK